MNSKLKNVVMVVVAIILIALVVVFIAKNEKEEPEPVEPTATPVLTPAPTTVPEDQSAFEVDVWAQYTEEEKEQFLSQVQWSPEFEEYIIKRDPEGHSDDPYYYQKMWLMYNPDYTVEGFENPYANEDASRPMGSLVEPGEYVNLEVPYEYAEGKTVYIGTNEAAETDGILLNFYCTEASPSMPIGMAAYPHPTRRKTSTTPPTGRTWGCIPASSRIGPMTVLPQLWTTPCGPASSGRISSLNRPGRNPTSFTPAW